MENPTATISLVWLGFISKGTGEDGAKKVIAKNGSVTIKGEGQITEVIDNRPYLDPKSRPSFRKNVPEKTFEKAKGPDGLVRDPLYPEKVIEWEPGQPRKNVWDMGHLPEHKYSEMHKRYLNEELTPKELRDWYNNPDNYRPELPSTNRSHKIE
ncbi:HNH/ENDO VII family nuclease [Solibacillus sp. R5-41]|uniref:HNH/ENDO VII family nuclease n=1 Tax=Solibacillus sp. R5-41 TaxID=2048654 RepID=UPI0020A23868|nr:HNH/ENDO VII family nuclease [Solibacillus sp. R5-41]